MPKEVTPDRSIEPASRELVITRIFDAPRELVFAAFTDPQHLMKWWGPHGCTVISCDADARPGGTWCISMRSPRVLPQFVQRNPINLDSSRENQWIVERQRGVYREVVTPERLVFTYAFEDDVGRPLHQTVVTVGFAEEGSRTKVTLHQAIFETVTARDDHMRGWTEALEHLAAYLVQV